MPKLRNKHRMDENFDPDEHREKERKRISAIIKRHKLQREQNENLKENYRLKETESVTYSEVFWAYRYLQKSGLREAVTQTVAPY